MAVNNNIKPIFILLISATVINAKLSSGLQKSDVDSNEATCHTPADIVFMVDSSYSILPSNFNNHVKPFLNKVVQTFQIGPDDEDTRVGLVLFSTTTYLQFYLRSYKTVSGIQAAINRTRFRGGDTYTHKAFNFASRVMFKPRYGARGSITEEGGAAKLLVVLTDGKSVDSRQTFVEADKLKAKGVDIFAVGVGPHVDSAELTSMSSGPQFTFQVADFKALDTISQRLAKSQCEVIEKETMQKSTTMMPTRFTTALPPANIRQTTTEQTTTEQTTSTEVPQDDMKLRECYGKPADIYFLLDASSSVYILDFKDRVLPFVKDIVSAFKISPKDTRVGVVTFSNDVDHSFGLSEYTDLQSLHDAIHPDTVEYLTGGTNTGDAIRHVSERFAYTAGARRGVAQIIITVTDGRSQKPRKTARAAADARQKGIYMFAVGVGKYVDDKELMDISSDPDEDFVFSVNNFDALASVTNLLASKTCKAVANEINFAPYNLESTIEQDQPMPLNSYICPSEATNIVFTYTYRNTIAKNTDLISGTIIDFTSDLQMIAPHIKVGVVSQPCIGGTTALTPVRKFQKARAQALARRYIGYPGIIRKLREEIFAQVPRSEKKIAVMFLDRNTRNVDLLQEEVRKMRFTNVKVVVVAIGKVNDNVVNSLVSLRTSTNVINVDSYADLQTNKLPLLNAFCNPRLSIVNDVTQVTQANPSITVLVRTKTGSNNQKIEYRQRNTISSDGVTMPSVTKTHSESNPKLVKNVANLTPSHIEYASSNDYYGTASKNVGSKNTQVNANLSGKVVNLNLPIKKTHSSVTIFSSRGSRPAESNVRVTIPKQNSVSSGNGQGSGSVQVSSTYWSNGKRNVSGNSNLEGFGLNSASNTFGSNGNIDSTRTVPSGHGQGSGSVHVSTTFGSSGKKNVSGNIDLEGVGLNTDATAFGLNENGNPTRFVSSGQEGSQSVHVSTTYWSNEKRNESGTDNLEGFGLNTDATAFGLNGKWDSSSIVSSGQEGSGSVHVATSYWSDEKMNASGKGDFQGTGTSSASNIYGSNNKINLTRTVSSEQGQEGSGSVHASTNGVSGNGNMEGFGLNAAATNFGLNGKSNSTGTVLSGSGSVHMSTSYLSNGNGQSPGNGNLEGSQLNPASNTYWSNGETNTQTGAGSSDNSQNTFGSKTVYTYWSNGKVDKTKTVFHGVGQEGSSGKPDASGNVNLQGLRLTSLSNTSLPNGDSTRKVTSHNGQGSGSVHVSTTYWSSGKRNISGNGNLEGQGLKPASNTIWSNGSKNSTRSVSSGQEGSGSVHVSTTYWSNGKINTSGNADMEGLGLNTAINTFGSNGKMNASANGILQSLGLNTNLPTVNSTRTVSSGNGQGSVHVSTTYWSNGKRNASGNGNLEGFGLNSSSNSFWSNGQRNATRTVSTGNGQGSGPVHVSTTYWSSGKMNASSNADLGSLGLKPNYTTIWSNGQLNASVIGILQALGLNPNTFLPNGNSTRTISSGKNGSVHLSTSYWSNGKMNVSSISDLEGFGLKPNTTTFWSNGKMNASVYGILQSLGLNPDTFWSKGNSTRTVSSGNGQGSVHVSTSYWSNGRRNESLEGFGLNPSSNNFWSNGKREESRHGNLEGTGSNAGVSSGNGQASGSVHVSTTYWSNGKRNASGNGNFEGSNPSTNNFWSNGKREEYLNGNLQGAGLNPDLSSGQGQGSVHVSTTYWSNGKRNASGNSHLAGSGLNSASNIYWLNRKQEGSRNGNLEGAGINPGVSSGNGQGSGSVHVSTTYWSNGKRNSSGNSHLEGSGLNPASNTHWSNGNTNTHTRTSSSESSQNTFGSKTVYTYWSNGKVNKTKTVFNGQEGARRMPVSTTYWSNGKTNYETRKVSPSDSQGKGFGSMPPKGSHVSGSKNVKHNSMSLYPKVASADSLQSKSTEKTTKSLDIDTKPTEMTNLFKETRTPKFIRVTKKTRQNKRRRGDVMPEIIAPRVIRRQTLPPMPLS